jgi:DUF4097 and DUF4098 domain-containing protein YvlB
MRRGMLVGLAALALSFAAAAAHADEWSKTYRVPGKPALQLHADNASVTVESGNDAEVYVHVTASGQRIPADVRIEEHQAENMIDVEVKQEHHWFEFHLGPVAVDVRVPASADLDVSTGNGKVTLEGIRGELRTETGNGAIDARGLEGSISLRSGNGRIEAEGLAGRLDAHTGNGSIHAAGRFAGLRLGSGRGNIEAVAETGSQATSLWSLTSGTGSITLGLPEDFSAELGASTGVGHISVDFPASVTGWLVGSSAEAKIGSGGERVKVETGVGNIHVSRASG